MNAPFVVVIPARLASTRLPNKPLQDIAGKPMIQHVWERACQSGAEKIVIATDHPQVLEVSRAFGATAVLTRAEHESGTDRLAEVALKMNLSADTIVVNVQGDEPLIPPQIIDQVAHNLAQHPQAAVATLAEPITQLEQLLSPHVVKVSTNVNQYALTFTRAPLPWARTAWSAGIESLPEGMVYRRHIGLYAYRAEFLQRFVAWGPCQLEQLECLEQLRALWHGVQIHVADACAAPPTGVDTPEDLERLRQYFKQA